MSPLKEALESPANKKALLTLSIIECKNPTPAAFTEIPPGVPSDVLLKDGNKRKSCKKRNLLAACYTFDECVAKVIGVREEADHQVVTSAIGPDDTPPPPEIITHKLACFTVLTEMGLVGDDNGWRGPLGRHIVSAAIRHEEPWRMQFAKQWLATAALRGEETFLSYLAHAYAWTANPSRLERIFELGVPRDHPQLLMTCLRYYRCDLGEGALDNGRDLVIDALLKGGAWIDDADFTHATAHPISGELNDSRYMALVARLAEVTRKPEPAKG